MLHASRMPFVRSLTEDAARCICRHCLSIAAPQTVCGAAILLRTGESDALRHHSSPMRTVRILATQSTKMDCPDDLVDDTFRDHHRNPHDCGPEKPGRREQDSNDHERPNSSKQVGTHRRCVYSKMVFDGAIPVLRFHRHCDLKSPSGAKNYHCCQKAQVIADVAKVTAIPHGFSLTTSLIPILAARLGTSLPRYRASAPQFRWVTHARSSFQSTSMNPMKGMAP